MDATGLENWKGWLDVDVDPPPKSKFGVEDGA